MQGSSHCATCSLQDLLLAHHSDRRTCLLHSFRISLKLAHENHHFNKPTENDCSNPTNLISGYGPKGILVWSSQSSKFFCISSNVVKYCRPLTVGIGTGPLQAKRIPQCCQVCTCAKFKHWPLCPQNYKCQWSLLEITHFRTCPGWWHHCSPTWRWNAHILLETFLIHYTTDIGKLPLLQIVCTPL